MARRDPFWEKKDYATLKERAELGSTALLLRRLQHDKEAQRRREWQVFLDAEVARRNTELQVEVAVLQASEKAWRTEWDSL